MDNSTSFFTNTEDIKNWLSDMGIKYYFINEDLTVDVEDSIHFHNKGLTHLPVQFGRVKGNVDLTRNQLTSLEGAPHEIIGSFTCNDNRLTNLDYHPLAIHGFFRCSHNPIEKFHKLDIDYCHTIYMSKVKGMEFLDQFEKKGKYTNTTLIKIAYDQFQELLAINALKDKLDTDLKLPHDKPILKI
jgi:hypothetical protein